jgi:hypothetical protein
MNISVKAFEAYKIRIKEQTQREKEMLKKFGSCVGINEDLTGEEKQAIRHYVDTGRRSKVFKSITK